MKLKRLDLTTPECPACDGCPAVFQLEGGDIAFIGTEVTNELLPHLPDGSGCAPHERIVTIPKSVLIDAIKSL